MVYLVVSTESGTTHRRLFFAHFKPCTGSQRGSRRKVFSSTDSSADRLLRRSYNCTNIRHLDFQASNKLKQTSVFRRP